jgi:hypothetical protein
MSNPRAIIVSAADAAFWPLLSGLLASIDHHRQRDGWSVGVLDLGLTPAQRERLARYGATVVAPEWDYDVARLTPVPPGQFKAMTARPHLPRYFPDHDPIVWIDADCWIQDWRAVNMLKLAAADFGLSIVPEIDRSYSTTFRDGSAFEFNVNCLQTCFGEEIATQLQYFPLLNGGVFAAVRTSPVWARWAAIYAETLDRLRTPFFFADQTALNVCVRLDKIPAALLPARCNWMCNRALPRLSFDGRLFVEPNPPFEPIGIMHLAANAKTELVTVTDLGGRAHSRMLTHAPLDE